MPGLPMGGRNGMAVLDVDQKNGKDGFASLRALGCDPEALSPVMVQSPGGSLHAYFRWPEGMGNSAAGHGRAGRRWLCAGPRRDPCGRRLSPSVRFPYR